MSLIDELSELSSETSSERRRDLLRGVTDLFLSSARNSDRQIGVFDEIFSAVVESVAVEARAEFAERIADRADAPVGVVETLAAGDIAVAAPLLARSPVISDAKLAAIAVNASQDHLLAMSDRKSLSEIITDVLVRRGGQKVVHRVAGNQGARFSANGFGELVRMANGDQELQARLVVRQDLPAEAVEGLLPQLSETLMIRLSEAGYGGEGRLPPQILQKVRDRLAAALDERDRVSRRLQGLIDAIRNGKLALSGLVGELCAENRVEDLATVLAAFADVDTSLAQSALSNPESDPIVLIARAVDLSFDAFLGIAGLRQRKFKAADADDPGLKTRYAKLASRDAQRSLRFVKVSSSVAASAA